MATIKEIRVKYDLNKEEDRIIYEKLTINTSQPGKIIKAIVKENIDNDFIKPTRSNQYDIDYSKELLSVIKSLSDKLDNLKVVSSQNEDDKEIIDEYVPVDTISISDTSDIDF